MSNRTGTLAMGCAPESFSVAVSVNTLPSWMGPALLATSVIVAPASEGCESTTTVTKSVDVDKPSFADSWKRYVPAWKNVTPVLGEDPFVNATLVGPLTSLHVIWRFGSP